LEVSLNESMILTLIMRFHVSLLTIFGIVQVEHSLVCSSLFFECSEGCDLNPEVNGPLVCGADGITYFNECFAVCQVGLLCHDHDVKQILNVSLI
jgi:Kazal-type serine protease inhibitor domain